jgi:hypothetical protein
VSDLWSHAAHNICTRTRGLKTACARRRSAIGFEHLLCRSMLCAGTEHFACECDVALHANLMLQTTGGTRRSLSPTKLYSWNGVENGRKKAALQNGKFEKLYRWQHNLGVLYIFPLSFRGSNQKCTFLGILTNVIYYLTKEKKHACTLTFKSTRCGFSKPTRSGFCGFW